MGTLIVGCWGFVGDVSLLVGALLGLYAAPFRRVPSASAASRACLQARMRPPDNPRCQQQSTT